MTRRAPTRPSPHLRRRRTCEPCASQVQRYDALTRYSTTQEDWRHHGCNRRLHSGSPFCWCSRQQRRRQKRAYGFMRISLDGRRHYTCFNRVNTRCVLRESHIVYVIGSICRGNWTYTGAFREFYLLFFFRIFLARYFEWNIFPWWKCWEKWFVYRSFSRNEIFTRQTCKYFDKLFY